MYSSEAPPPQTFQYKDGGSSIYYLLTVGDTPQPDNREGNGVDSEEWRWERWNDSPTISDSQEHEYVARLRDVDLFSIRGFL